MASTGATTGKMAGRRPEQGQAARFVRQMGWAKFLKKGLTARVTTNLKQLVYVSTTPKKGPVTGKLPTSAVQSYQIWHSTAKTSAGVLCFHRLTCNAKASGLTFWFDMTGYV